MSKRRGRKSIQYIRYKEFLKVAEHFYSAASDSMELEYWTAAGVLIVHSAIAYADALSIKISATKSAGEDHEDTIALLEEVVADNEEKSKAINQLRRIIEEKTRVSYLGELYTASQIKEIWKRLERFRKWAKDIIIR